MARSRIAITIVLALSAGVALSLFDIALQHWGVNHRPTIFLPAMFMFALLFSLPLIPWIDRPAHLKATRSFKWILAGTVLMALQAMSMSWSLSGYGDAARINIVYSLRSLWGVLLAWSLARFVGGAESHLGLRVMLMRLGGALLLTAAVVLAITA